MDTRELDNLDAEIERLRAALEAIVSAHTRAGYEGAEEEMYDIAAAALAH